MGVPWENCSLAPLANYPSSAAASSIELSRLSFWRRKGKEASDEDIVVGLARTHPYGLLVLEMFSTIARRVRNIPK